MERDREMGKDKPQKEEYITKTKLDIQAETKESWAKKQVG